jgi:hypothetical protein
MVIDMAARPPQDSAEEKQIAYENQRIEWWASDIRFALTNSPESIATDRVAIRSPAAWTSPALRRSVIPTEAKQPHGPANSTRASKPA